MNIKIWVKQRFGKDWKFFWMTDSYLGKFFKKICDYLGLKLLFLSRRLMRIGGKRCSWCGEEQNKHTGLHMSASRKGFRCGKLPVSCSDKPFV